jgi:tetratricopeptide (TPR) repeat protein
MAAWPCVLLPDAVPDHARIVALAEAQVGRGPPDNDALLITLGAAFYRAGRLEEALWRLGEGYAASQATPAKGRHTCPANAAFFIAMAQHRLGRGEQARGWLRQGIRGMEQELKGSDQPGGPSWNRRLALELLRGEAERVLASPPPAGGTRHPETPEAQQAVAWFLATCAEPQLRDPDRAVLLATKAVQSAPGNGFCWQTLGVAEYRVGKWKAALQALDRVRELGSAGDSFEWFFLAMAHWQLGHNEQARKWYAPAVLWMEKHWPNHPELSRFRAEAAALLGVQGQPLTVRPPAGHEDVAIWTLVLRAMPDHPYARTKRAESYAALAEWDQAAADYSKGIELQPPNETWFQLACCRLLTRDTKGYRRLCGQGLERVRAATDPFAAYLVGRICSLGPEGAGEPARVVRLVELAVKSQPRCAWFLHTQGAVQYRAGNFDQAVERCRESLRVQPEWPGAMLNWLVLAMAHERLGHPAEARQWWVKVGEWKEQAPRGNDPGAVLCPPGLHPSDWLEFNVLYREAAPLLKEPPTAQATVEGK